MEGRAPLLNSQSVGKFGRVTFVDHFDGGIMELDETNKGQVKRLFAFLKGKRDRHLKELAEVAADVKDDKCGDEMTIYNQDDVQCEARSF